MEVHLSLREHNHDIGFVESSVNLTMHFGADRPLLLDGFNETANRKLKCVAIALPDPMYALRRGASSDPW